VVASIVLTLLVGGCRGADPLPGVYLARPPDGSPGWIGAPAGVPVWSPDGSKVAWGTEDGLIVYDTGENERLTLIDDAVAGRPAWSPNGDALAYVNRQTMKLEVLEIDSGHVRYSLPIGLGSISQESIPLVVVGGPAWSPDGERIAFGCWDGEGDEICIVDADGRNRRQLTDVEATATGNQTTSGAPAVANSGYPSWSPDGRLLAVAVFGDRRGAPSGVFTIDSELGTARKISSLQPNGEIRWTPNGNAVVFSATVEGRSDAHRVPVNGRAAATLTGDLPGGAFSPALSSDGARMAVASGGEIVVIDLASGEREFIGTALAEKYPAWDSTGETVAFAADVDPILVYD
jgi:Tol biopolymer transport system component